MAAAIKNAISSTTSSSKNENVDSDGTDRGEHYRLRITAGPTYDKSLQKLITPNSHTALSVSPNLDLSLRIKDYSGFPSCAPPTDDAYFSLPEHAKDSFSISFAFTPPRDIPVGDLMFGVDTGHNPIRKFGIPKSLVNGAFRVIKEFIDPSLACDVSADEPWMRGPVVAGSTTTLCVGEQKNSNNTSNDGHSRTDSCLGEDGRPSTDQPRKSSSSSLSPPAEPRRSSMFSWSRDPSPDDPVPDLTDRTFPDPALLIEGATSQSAAQHRRDILGVPSLNPSRRRKHFNKDANLSAAALRKGRTYYFDFANGYIDWSKYAVKLPGFSVPVLKYLGKGVAPGTEEAKKKKSPGHKVRFFLKDVKTGEVFFVIMATLITGDELGKAQREDDEMVGKMRGQQQEQKKKDDGEEEEEFSDAQEVIED